MQKTNSKNYEEIEIQNKAVKAGSIGVLALCTIFYLLEVVLLKVQNYGWYSIIALYCTIVYGYKAFKMPKKYNWFLSFIWFLATIACVFNYVIHRF